MECNFAPFDAKHYKLFPDSIDLSSNDGNYSFMYYIMFLVFFFVCFCCFIIIIIIIIMVYIFYFTPFSPESKRIPIQTM